MALTDAACRAAKAGPERLKLYDGDGLQLWVQKSGSKLWNFSYRYDGKQRQLAFGPYPEVGLGEARSQRERARKLLRDGLDPAANWSLAPAQEGSDQEANFKEIALEYIEKRRKEGLATPTMIKKKWLLDFAYRTQRVFVARPCEYQPSNFRKHDEFGFAAHGVFGHGNDLTRLSRDCFHASK
mgnify:CR=1 FL=1